MSRNRRVLKVAVLGEEGTGKSCIVVRYVEGRFARATTPTTGADFSATRITVNSHDYLYQLWDVGGKWRMSPGLGSEFWADVSGCILVLDVTNSASLACLDDLRMKVHQESSYEDIPLILVGNKCDLDGRRVVTREQAESWCDGKDVPFFETSAKTGAGLEAAFQLLADCAVTFYNKHHLDVQTAPSRDSFYTTAYRPVLKSVSKIVKFGKQSITKLKPKHSRGQATVNTDVVSSCDGTSGACTTQELPKQCHEEQLSERTEHERTLHRQLEEEQKRAQELVMRIELQKREFQEKTRLLESQQVKVEAMQHALNQKDQVIDDLTKTLHKVKNERQTFVEPSTRVLESSHKISELHSVEHQSEDVKFWEVRRGDVEVDMSKLVGTGAWGYVVEGMFRGKQVAVKCLHSLICQPQFLRSIRREIDIMARVRHPNLVLFIAAVLDNETGPMIITELLDTSLRRAYEQNLLHKSSVPGIFLDVALALNYLHLLGDGIIHRDVSSANVLLEVKPDRQWKAKLSDFGSANLIRDSTTVGPGAIVYSAPEVKVEASSPQTPKVDVYSYGVLVCEVLLCRFPIGEHLHDMLEEVKGKWPLLHSLAHSCTQYTPENRPSMAMVIGMLKQISCLC